MFRRILQLKKGNYRYLKTVIKPFGVAPEWQAAAGNRVWLFVDEIIFY